MTVSFANITFKHFLMKKIWNFLKKIVSLQSKNKT